MIESDQLIKEIASRTTDWAIDKFEDELRSGFQKIDLFDSPWNEEISRVLKGRPKNELEILAKVLPLGVFWQLPDMIDVRRRLAIREREAVERFRADYDRLCKENFSQQVERVSESRSPLAVRRLKSASPKGRKIVNEIGSEWGWESVSAGAGEWGLVFRGGRITTTVSLNLGRNFSLSYAISLFDTIHSRTLRYQDDYFKVLGLGDGGWQIGANDNFRKKIVQICEFASWHVHEYRRILKDIIEF
jgi:hypothetical protein